MIIVISIFFLFYGRGEVALHSNRTILDGGEKQFLLSFEDFKLDGNHFSATANEIKRKEKLIVKYEIVSKNEKDDIHKNLKYGMVCKVSGQLEELKEASNINAFDYKQFLNRKNIFWQLRLNQFKLDQCEVKYSLLNRVNQIRQKGTSYIVEHFPVNTAPLASALIFGERSLIDSNLQLAYQRLGIIHLLAISGLHVGMLVGMLFYLGVRFGITREMMLSNLLLFLPLYMILTGATPSVVRACMMMIVVIILQKIRHTLVTADVVSVVCLMCILYSPYVIFEIGFQLSFIVTFSLVLSSPILERSMGNPLRLLIHTSLIAQIASAPILLYHFFEFSLVSIIANVLYVPLFSLFILPLVISLLFFHLVLGEIINPLLYLVNTFLTYLNELTANIASFPYAMFTLGKPSTTILAIDLILLAVYFTLWEKQKKNRYILISILAPICLTQIISTQFLSKGEITFIDVGQGDSVLIKLPNGKGVYLIDTGGTIQFPVEEWKKRKEPFEVGKNVVVPYLKSKGITKIDKLILTHGDMDHIGGASAVIENIRVKEIVLPDVLEQSVLEKNLINNARGKGIQIKFVKSGDSWKVSDTSFRILSPSKENYTNRNDGSIVLYAELGGLRWLFTGDLEKEGEEQLIHNYPNVTVDILKIGHHGSHSSTTTALLDRYNPKVAIISVGRSNRFGHPHPDVINRLDERKIKIFRTDQQGAITYFFSGKSGTFLTKLP